MIIKKASDWFNNTHQATPWENAIFKDVYNMTNDARGQFGESIISDACHMINANIQEDITNTNVKNDGAHYDIKVNDYRIEVKTSCISTSDAWQHEPLYFENVCDKVIFIDFSYDCFYIAVVDNVDLPLGGRDNPTMFGRKHGTLRKNKDDGFKLDFSKTTINTLIKSGHCKKFEASATIEDVAEWIGDFIK